MQPDAASRVSRADRAEAAFWAAFLRNRNVDAGTAHDGAVPVAGGYALCVTGTLLAHVVGAGATRPLRVDDCEVVEGFYEARSLPARFELAYDVLQRDEALLRGRGYADEETVLAVLQAPVAAPTIPREIAVRATNDRRAWSDLVVRAAADEVDDAGLLRRTAQLSAAAAQVLVVASVDGRDVGAGALGIWGEAALLYSGCVLPTFRRRGVHQALVAARMTFAQKRDATEVTMKAVPDSPAERSAAHFGFTRVGLRRRIRRGS